MRQNRFGTGLWAGLVCGSLLVGGALAFGDDQQPAANTPAAQDSNQSSVQAPALPSGFTAKELHATGHIRSELATLASDAVRKGHFDSYVDNLAKQDKTRVGEFKNQDFTVLDGRIDQIRKAWRDKYGKDFDIDRDAFDNRFAIAQGEVADPAMALANWPVPAVGAEAMTASQTQRPADSNVENKSETQAEKEAKLDKGRNVALVSFPASHGYPAITVSMIHELPNQWRVDIPNDRTGQQIYNDLLTQLTYLGDHTEKWPADVNDAGRMFAHAAVAALYGVKMESATGDQSMSGQR